MLTAAVRDLHHCYPGEFLTDVRTLCPDIWDHNPYLTPLEENDPEVQSLECSYPLINRCNQAPYHCLHGFIEFLNEQLKLSIRPTVFKGDIHLSPQEKAWYSQVHEVTGKDTPFWIMVAGGKHDVTVKWWDQDRYQAVVDHFQGSIQFVQIGRQGHYHPKLRGTIDFRGQTSLRELIRLVYHSQGVLCPVTAAMHLAAAVPVKPGQLDHRPCVVVAGGREPAHWEAYPNHQFIQNVGTLFCSQQGGCWKDRVKPLGDGDPRDRPRNRCVDVVGNLPRCMDMIGADEVIRRIETYYKGGVLSQLSRTQWHHAKKGIQATLENSIDRQPLNLSSAREACETFIANMEGNPGGYSGHGIVICGGGVDYFTNAWVCIRRLRDLGNDWPIELWHLGEKELDQTMADLVRPLGVRCVDASEKRKEYPVRRLWGWPLKPYAILHSSFEQVLFLDADNVPVRDPAYLLESQPFRRTGAMFWPDRLRWDRSDPVWKSCRLRRPSEMEFESGQLLVDKNRCWKALRLALWFNEHDDFYYRYLHGDKETFHLAFRKLKSSYYLVPHPLKDVRGTFYQHDHEGERIFQHRCAAKWKFEGNNSRIPGFLGESKCRKWLSELRRLWNGKIKTGSKKRLSRRVHSR